MEKTSLKVAQIGLSPTLAESQTMLFVICEVTYVLKLFTRVKFIAMAVAITINPHSAVNISTLVFLTTIAMFFPIFNVPDILMFYRNLT